MKYMYINLDRSPERNVRMQHDVQTYFPKYTFERIRAIDGQQWPDDIIKHPAGSPGVNGCFASHIVCMQKLIDDPMESHAIVLEDDVSMEYVKYWQPYHWDLFDRGTTECDILQLGCVGPYHGNLTHLKPKHKQQWSTVAYMITKDAAKKIVSMVSPLHDNKKYDLSKVDNPHADNIIYSLANTKILPMFTHTRESFSYVSESNIRENKKYETWRQHVENKWKSFLL